ncbi:MAG: SAM-dependent methyltransferase [Bacteroidia bacterium]|nr:SAM-dependent methyltransferase [Bacteroidia bacterium]
MSNNYGKLYLIPNFLSEDNPDEFIAEMVRKMVHQLRNFVVENEKQGRALIKRLNIQHSQQELQIWLLNEHTPKIEIAGLLKALENEDAGIISDAGLPCIADPGSDLVALAQQKNIEVIALPGASSMMMALMASGFNGQQFSFSGYLPVERPMRIKKIKALEALMYGGLTQLFMETPYRNNHVLEDLLQQCLDQTKLCIGCAVSGNNGWVRTKTVLEWKKHKPDLHKKPCIFILGK